MRRLFIIRKDLHLSGGKLSAMVGHCCEAYWTNLLKKSFNDAVKDGLADTSTDDCVGFPIDIDYNIWHQYVNGIFTKTICEAKNKNQLMKIIELINEHNNQVIHKDEMLIKDIDYGFINDCCLTELTPENEDGTTTVGIWFKPLPDDIAHKFSKKYKLYRD
jgi:peptidyl-tRNA hydrolase